MDPYYEERLRQEVIYLHSLWHQGPPTSGLHKRKMTQHHNSKNKLSKPDPPSNSGTQCPTPAPPGCPNPNPISGPSALLASEEERARHSVLKLQYKAFDTFREFLKERGSDSDDDDDEDEDYLVDNGDEKYQLFLRVFTEDWELRRYYEENFEGGEFCCLVCGGLGKKNSGKMFKSCLGLVQHSVAVSISESNDSHTALAQVICRVLGWDFDRLPVIVSKGEPLGRILAKKGETQGKPEAIVKENVVAGNGNGNGGDFGEKDTSDSKLVNCEGNVGDEGAHKELEKIDEGVSETGGNEKAAPNEPGSNQPLVSTSEWPCEKPVQNTPSAALEWPAFKPHLASTDLASTANSISAEDQAMLAAVQLQHDAVKACQNYFTGKYDSDSDENDDEEEEREASEDSKDADDEDNEEEDPCDDSDEEEDCDYEDDEEEESKDSKLFTYFSKLFMENDGKLRDFYVNNCKAGQFCCLVCGGIRKKAWKRFRGCVALVQHSTAISKTKKKLAHRAYGLVVCQVLGWDINRFPSIALKDEALGQPVENSGNSQGKPKEDSDHLKDNLNLSINNSDVSNGDNDKTVSDKDSGAHHNEISMKNELPTTSSSPVQSSMKSAELQQQGEPKENCEARNDGFDRGSVPT